MKKWRMGRNEAIFFIIGIASNLGAPLILLAIRFWMARVFFAAGLTKLRDWETTLFLFEMEYAVPILPHNIVALMATFFELVMPALLVIGFASRFAALPLLAMVLVIQFVLGAANPAYDIVEHFYWMMLLLVIILIGPGKLSIDYFLRQFAEKQKPMM